MLEDTNCPKWNSDFTFDVMGMGSPEVMREATVALFLKRCTYPRRTFDSPSSSLLLRYTIARGLHPLTYLL